MLTLHLTSSGQVTPTPGHLFFVEGKGFVPAGHLAIGNAIVTRAGPAVTITAIHTGGVATVYNLEVGRAHTYFVGSTNGGLWVHNTCSAEGGGGGPSAPSNPPSSGTTKPPTTDGPPGSVYTHINDRGQAVQNAVYDGDGNVIGHVDFKNHGPGAPSGHWHEFPTPGDPSSGHGPGMPHNPPSTLPPGWGDLPPGIPPHTPIGS